MELGRSEPKSGPLQKDGPNKPGRTAPARAAVAPFQKETFVELITT